MTIVYGIVWSLSNSMLYDNVCGYLMTAYFMSMFGVPMTAWCMSVYGSVRSSL